MARSVKNNRPGRLRQKRLPGLEDVSTLDLDSKVILDFPEVILTLQDVFLELVAVFLKFLAERSKLLIVLFEPLLGLPQEAAKLLLPAEGTGKLFG